MLLRPVARLRLHPRAALVPPMSTAEWVDFLGSVEADGIKEPLRILDDGLVLDGRHRLRAAEKLGIPKVPVLVVDLGDEDAVDYMVTAALARRHLNPGQRAALALDLAAYHEERERAAERKVSGGRKGGRKKSKGKLEEDVPHATPKRGPQSREVIGKRVGVSGRLVQDALRVQREAPDLLDLVRRGELTLRCAHSRLKTRVNSRKESQAVYTSYTGENADLIREVARLYIRDGARVADVTYGRGSFWGKVDTRRFHLVPSDLVTVPHAAYDFRELPYGDGEFDVLLLDPPFRHDEGVEGHPDLEAAYRGSKTKTGSGHQAVVDLYRAGLEEARRVVKPGGLALVKCQDEVDERYRQAWTHIEVQQMAAKLGFEAVDLFVLTRMGKPPVRKPQRHARKNHSYLWVLRRP